jgi:O-methyltransferase involved in polyketide biosynthesis
MYSATSGGTSASVSADTHVPSFGVTAVVAFVFIHRMIAELLADGVDTIVNLGAGLDLTGRPAGGITSC